MNIKLILLPLALALPVVLTSCGEAVDAADSAAQSATGAAGGLMDKMKNVNLDDLGADKIKEMGGSAVAKLTEQLGSIKDMADVEKLKGMLPTIEKLGAMKDKLGAALPGTDALKGAVEKLTSQFSGDSGMMGALQPIIDKLKSLIA